MSVQETVDKIQKLENTYYDSEDTYKQALLDIFINKKSTSSAAITKIINYLEYLKKNYHKDINPNDIQNLISSLEQKQIKLIAIEIIKLSSYFDKHHGGQHISGGSLVRKFFIYDKYTNSDVENIKIYLNFLKSISSDLRMLPGANYSVSDDEIDLLIRKLPAPAAALPAEAPPGTGGKYSKKTKHKRKTRKNLRKKYKNKSRKRKLKKHKKKSKTFKK
jgi:hypothetical protein